MKEQNAVPAKPAAGSSGSPTVPSGHPAAAPQAYRCLNLKPTIAAACPFTNCTSSPSCARRTMMQQHRACPIDDPIATTRHNPLLTCGARPARAAAPGAARGGGSGRPPPLPRPIRCSWLHRCMGTHDSNVVWVCLARQGGQHKATTPALAAHRCRDPQREAARELGGAGRMMPPPQPCWLASNPYTRVSVQRMRTCFKLQLAHRHKAQLGEVWCMPQHAVRAAAGGGSKQVVRCREAQLGEVGCVRGAAHRPSCGHQEQRRVVRGTRAGRRHAQCRRGAHQLPS